MWQGGSCQCWSLSALTASKLARVPPSQAESSSLHLSQQTSQQARKLLGVRAVHVDLPSFTDRPRGSSRIPMPSFLFYVFPPYPASWRSFLPLWSNKKSSASFQLVFRESCSTWRCIFFFFWLHWVFSAVHGLSLVAASGGYSSLRCMGFSLWWLLFLAKHWL